MHLFFIFADNLYIHVFRMQMKVFVEHGKCQNVHDVVALVLVKDYLEVIQQLNSIIDAALSSQVNS